MPDRQSSNVARRDVAPMPTPMSMRRRGIVVPPEQIVERRTLLLFAEGKIHFLLLFFL
jgi:hypothetical protein